MKKTITFIFMLLTVFVLCSCNKQSIVIPKSTSTTKNSTSKTISSTFTTKTESPYEKWLKSGDAFDFDCNNEIDENDYSIFLRYNEWLDSEEAIDINEDRRVNYDDYKLLEEYKKWKKSNEAIDLNDDKKISFDDYYIYLEYIEWLESNAKEDLNNDSIFDVEDYLIFISSTYNDYLVWKKGVYSVDANKDGELSFEDYKVYLEYLSWTEEDKNLIDYNKDNSVDIEDYYFYLKASTWIESLNAYDFNSDNVVNVTDYDIYISFTKWLNSDLSSDINKDSNIDYDDYILYLEYNKWITTVDAFDYNEDNNINEEDYFLFIQANSKYIVPEGGYDGSEITITFYHTMSKMVLQPVLNAYIEEFNKIYPNIHINHKTIGGYDDLKSQIANELVDGNSPNIAYCYADHVALYNLSGKVVPLDALINDKNVGLTNTEKSNFINGFYNEGRSFEDGLFYMMPFSKSTDLMYYNDTYLLLNNLSVPTHWFSVNSNDTTSVEYVIKKIKEIDPTSIPLSVDNESNWFINLCEQSGADFTSLYDEHFLFNNDIIKNIVLKLREWYNLGLITTQKIYGSYTSGLFVETDTTKAHSYISICSSVHATHQRPVKVKITKEDGTEESVYPFNVGIASIPQMDLYNMKATFQGPSVCIFNKTNPQEVVASWLFVKFLTTSVDFQAEFSMASGYVPVIKNVVKNQAYASYLAKADGGNNIDALSAKVCIQQFNMYFCPCSFHGMEYARQYAGDLISTAFVRQANNEKEMIDSLFEERVEECKNLVLNQTNTIGKAASYLIELYKNKTGTLKEGFELAKKVTIDNTTINVDWELDGVPSEFATAIKIINIDEKQYLYIDYYSNEITETVWFNINPIIIYQGQRIKLSEIEETLDVFRCCVIPLILGNRQDWEALQNDRTTSINIKGVVTGVRQDGSSKGSFHFQDEDGYGYYAYMPIDSVTNDGKFNVKAGDLVIVSGTRSDYSGHQEFAKGCTFKVIGSNQTPTVIDGSADWAAATYNTDLDPKYQNNYIKLENCKAVAIPTDGETEFLFTVGEGTVQWSIYDCYYFLTTEQRDAFKAAWAQAYNDGATFTVEGIVFPYLSEYQIYGATFKPEIITLTTDGVNE